MGNWGLFELLIILVALGLFGGLIYLFKSLGSGKKEAKFEIAKKMIKGGEPVEKISQYTGLSKSEIEKL